MPFAKPLPEWNAVGVEPPQSLKDEGWKPIQKPPADYFNWFMHYVYQALLELQQKAGETKTVNGQTPDANGNVTVAAGVTSVNGQTGAITGIETTAGAQKKISDAIAALINGAPGAFDTLKELAEAMGNDPNFAATITNALASKETPEGAKAKADEAEARAKAYTDTAPETMLQNMERFGTKRSSKNENGTFLSVEKKRKDGTLFMKSEFSEPNADGNPTVRTITTYAADGVTVVGKPVVYDVIYDADGDYVEEVPR